MAPRPRAVEEYPDEPQPGRFTGARLRVLEERSKPGHTDSAEEKTRGDRPISKALEKPKTRNVRACQVPGSVSATAVGEISSDSQRSVSLVIPETRRSKSEIFSIFSLFRRGLGRVARDFERGSRRAITPRRTSPAPTRDSVPVMMAHIVPRVLPVFCTERKVRRERPALRVECSSREQISPRPRKRVFVVVRTRSPARDDDRVGASTRPPPPPHSRAPRRCILTSYAYPVNHPRPSSSSGALQPQGFSIVQSVSPRQRRFPRREQKSDSRDSRRS